MNIFEELDVLLNSIQESKETEVSYSDVPISKDMETAEQAVTYVRKYVMSQLLDNGGSDDDSDEDSEDPRILPPEPPLPPIIRRRLPIFDDSKDARKDWESEEIEWGEDEFIKRLELEAEALDEIEDDGDSDYKTGDDYDDFLDKSKKSVSSASEGGEGSGDGDGDDESSDIDDDSTDDGESKKSSRKKMKKEDTETEWGSGEDDVDSEKKKSELERSIGDALEKLKERTDIEKEDLKDLIEALKDDNSTVDDIERKEEEIIGDKSRKKEKFDKLKSLAGRLETAPSKEEIEKEIEAAKLSPEEIKRMKESTVEGALSAEPPSDSELDSIRREAMVELDKKCKGYSSLKTSILYHSLKAAKIEDDDWEKLVEKILKDKSIHKGEIEDEKVKKVRLGDKNHLWRRDVRYFKKYEKGGAETQSIYCFVDYSGSVASQPGLIVAFLGRILHLCFRLEYTDICTYVFGDNLSLPRIINHKMLEEDGYEKVLANTLEYFDSQRSYIGGGIENFRDVGNEINRIKSKDKDAVIFIFGDGYWTFYGNSNPPTRLVEICPRHIKDICAFIFYEKDEDVKTGDLPKEISLLKEVVGIKDVIITKVSALKE